MNSSRSRSRAAKSRASAIALVRVLLSTTHGWPDGRLPRRCVECDARCQPPRWLARLRRCNAASDTIRCDVTADGRHVGDCDGKIAWLSLSAPGCRRATRHRRSAAAAAAAAVRRDLSTTAVVLPLPTIRFQGIPVAVE
jgi:hypothetical protein